MGRGIAITGMGIVSAIGNNVAANYSALRSAQSGIRSLTYIDSIHKGQLPVGEVMASNIDFHQILKLNPDRNYSRTALLGIMAAKEAVNRAGIQDINAVETGLVSSSTVGGMDMTERYFHQGPYGMEAQKYCCTHPIEDATQKIADSLGLKHGFITSISTACSSGANAIMLGARLIKSGKFQRVIVGGTDCLSKFTINGFNSLMILSGEHCKPFDAERKGLNLGEAAAYLVLESDSLLKKNPKKVLAYVKGYGNANDAFHQTASSQDGVGAQLAMEKALEIAQLSPKDIDYINVHGTATENNDLSEGRALSKIFGVDSIPDFSSTKPFSGHTLAAAGAVEAVFSLLSIENDVVFPNLNYTTPIEEFKCQPQRTLKDKKINFVLSNSLGFGGNCTSLIFSKNP